MKGSPKEVTAYREKVLITRIERARQAARAEKAQEA
jgi:hypothetical protein